MSRRQDRISNRGNAKVGEDREDIERQAESKGRQQTVRVYRQSRKTQGNRIQGKRSEMSAGAKQDFATCVGKCAAYMCV